MKKYETAQQLIDELRSEGYKSYEELDKSCPADHDCYTACMSDKEGVQVHSCEECKQYYVIN